MIAISKRAHPNCFALVAAYAMSQSSVHMAQKIDIESLKFPVAHEKGGEPFFLEKPKRTYPKIPPKRLK